MAKKANAKVDLLKNSKIFKRLGRIRAQVPSSELKLEGYGRELWPWGDSFIVTTLIKGNIYDTDATIGLFHLTLTGGTDFKIEDKKVFEGVSFSKSFVFQNQLYLVFKDKKDKAFADVYEKAPRGKLKRIKAGLTGKLFDDYSVLFRSSTAWTDDLILLPEKTNRDLTIFAKTGDEFSQVGKMKTVFGEKRQFGTNRGCSSIDIRGDRAVLAGPDDRTGFKLVDISDPSKPKEIATAAGKQNQQNIVRFLDDHLFVAFGNYGKAQVYEFLEEKRKFKNHGTIPILDHWTKMYQEENEALFYANRTENSTESGCVIRFGDGKPVKLGELEFPFPTRQILVDDAKVVLLGMKEIAIYQKNNVITKDVPPPRRRTVMDRHHVAPPDNFRDKGGPA